MASILLKAMEALGREVITKQIFNSREAKI
jgi:hypothetical protein